MTSKTAVITVSVFLIVGLVVAMLFMWPRFMTTENQVLHYGRSGNWKAFVKGVERCSQVDFFDAYGQTPLSLASYQDDTAIIRMLINRGADVNLPEGGYGSGGSTALHIAAGRGNTEVAAALLKAGASPHTLNRYERTPLATACAGWYVVHPDMLELLLKNGADTNVTDRYGWAPLHLLLRRVEKPDKALVEVLLEYGADPAMRNISPYSTGGDSRPFPGPSGPFGLTPWELAADGGYTDILEVLKAHMELPSGDKR